MIAIVSHCKSETAFRLKNHLSSKLSQTLPNWHRRNSPYPWFMNSDAPSRDLSQHAGSAQQVHCYTVKLQDFFLRRLFNSCCLMQTEFCNQELCPPLKCKSEKYRLRCLCRVEYGCWRQKFCGKMMEYDRNGILLPKLF